MSESTLLIQPSIRDPSNEAIAGPGIAERITDLDLTPLLVYRIDSVVPAALPLLCQQFSRMGYDGWFFASTDAEKRSLIKSAIVWHRLKGTLAGFRAAARLAKSTVVRAVQPPAKIYMAPALSQGERNAFLSRYPELRLYPFRHRGQRVGMLLRGSFCGRGDLTGGRAAWEFPMGSDAVTRLGEVGYLMRGGVETPITTLQRDLHTIEVRAGGQAGRAKFCGRLIPIDYPRASEAAARLYRTRFTGPYAYTGETLHLRTLTPGLAPILINYQMTALPGRAVGTFMGARQTAACRWSQVAGWLVDHRAPDRLFKRWHLFDPAVPVITRGASLFVGAQRFGMPAYHAELLTSVPGRHSPRLIGVYAAGFWPTADHAKLDATLAVFRAVTRCADRVKVNTKTHSKIRALSTRYADPTLISGQFIAN